MFCKTFKINTHDYTQYAHKNGLSIAYNHLSGLPDKITLDGTLHDDVIANKSTYTIRLNPVKPDIAKSILQDYKQSQVFLTIFDPSEGIDKIILCKTQTANVIDPFVKLGSILYWQISPLVFREK